MLAPWCARRVGRLMRGRASCAGVFGGRRAGRARPSPTRAPARLSRCLHPPPPRGCTRARGRPPLPRVQSFSAQGRVGGRVGGCARRRQRRRGRAPPPFRHPSTHTCTSTSGRAAFRRWEATAAPKPAPTKAIRCWAAASAVPPTNASSTSTSSAMSRVCRGACAAGGGQTSRPIAS